MKKCSLLIVLLAFAYNAFSQVYQPEHWDGYLSIKVKNDSSHASIAYPQEGVQSPFDTLISAFGIYSIHHAFIDTNNASLSRCYKLRFSDSTRMDSLIVRLKNYPFLEYVSKVGIGQFYEDSPDDSKYHFQWAMQKILADSVWQLLPGDGKRIKIAVIDDAFLLGHEDLAAAIDTNYDDPIDVVPNDDDGNTFDDDYLGWDFADSDNYVLPPAHVRVKQYSHGTHCAIIAGGVTDNEKGIATFNRGNIKIIPIKNTKDDNWTPTLVTYSAMEYAKNMGANVISMSFSSWDDDDSVFMKANPQIIFVVAVGNLEDSSVSKGNVNKLSLYNLPNLISVGATGIYDEKTSFSSYHSTVDIMAPGAGMLSGLGTGTDQYGYKNGTSQATPLVAGLCAALWSYDSTLTAQQVIDRVLNTADDISFENPDIKWQIGHGRINAYRAFNNITTQPHQASFKTDKPRSLCQGDTITFIARNYSGVQYVWNFGDGVIDTTADSSMMHICSVTGNFSVSLTLLDSASNDTLAHHINGDYYGVTICSPLVSDQSQWYFGHYGEVDFRSGRPVVKDNAYVNNTLHADEGTFTVNNSNGDLLFYGGNRTSTGEELVIYNKNHQIVHQSTLIFGNPSQGYICVPFLNSNYLFASDIHSFGISAGLHYLRIDTTATSIVVNGPYPVYPSGMAPPVLISDTGAMKTDESITAIPNCENNGYWIIVSGNQYDTNYRDKIIVLELYDSSGTAAIRYHNNIWNVPGKGMVQTRLKVSPDGKFVAITNQHDIDGLVVENTSSVFSFQNKTGTLDSLFSFPFGGLGGISFSPNSRFLYIQDIDGSLMYQVDLYSPNPVETKVYNPNDNIITDMLIGPDGKIYISYLVSKTLGVIDFPDSLNTFDNLNKAGYRFVAIELLANTKTTLLPNFVNAIVPDSIPKNFEVIQSNCSDVTFFATPACDTSVFWDFGDGDTSNVFKPTHSYTDPGNYTVKMVMGGDTITKTVKTGIVSEIYGDTTICDTSYIYPFETDKNDYYSYQWSAINGVILTDLTAYKIEAKFAQTGTLKVVVTDSRTGCMDSSLVNPTYGMDIQGNTITLDSQPCLAYLNGTTLIPGAGTTSYSWLYGKDTSNWDPVDTTEDIAYFIAKDSLFFKRVATNANCQSTSNYVVVLSKPQIALTLLPAFVCDNDTVNYTDFEILLSNWDSNAVWIHAYKKDSGDVTYNFIDSFEYVHDTTRNIGTRPGDSLYFSVNALCGTVTSRTAGIPTLSQSNTLSVDSMPCFRGFPFSVSGSLLLSSIPLTYEWEFSPDSVNWTPTADTTMNFVSSFAYSSDSIYLRRIISNGNCQSISAPVKIKPKTLIITQPTGRFVCGSTSSFVDVQMVLDNQEPDSVLVVVEQKPTAGSFIGVDSFYSTGPVNYNLEVEALDSVRFRLVSACGTIYSNTIFFKECTTPPGFSIQTQNLSINEDTSAYFFVYVQNGCGTGAGVPGLESWHWEVNYHTGGLIWTELDNSDNDTLFLDSISYCNNGYRYRAVYNNGCGASITSSSATLTVTKTNFAKLMMRDYYDDDGTEPNNTTDWRNLYDPPSFLIRLDSAWGPEHEIPNWGTDTAYVFYTIHNIDSTDTSKPAKLKMYWNLGGPHGADWSLAWSNTFGNLFLNLDSDNDSSYLKFYPYGDYINEIPIEVPSIAPGDSIRDYFMWTDFPNPMRYYVWKNDTIHYDNPRPMCLLARIETCPQDSFGMSYKEVTATRQNIINNRKIVGRNTSVTNFDGTYGKKEVPLTIRRFAGDNEPIRITLEEVGNCGFALYGRVNAILSDALWEAWRDGGYVGSGYSVGTYGVLEVTDLSDFELGNIDLDPDSVSTITFEFELVGTPLTTLNCRYAVAQYQGESSLTPYGTFVMNVNVIVEPDGGLVQQVKEPLAKEQDSPGFKGEAFEGETKLPEEETVSEENTLIEKSLFAYPNPFTNEVNFYFELAEGENVGFEIYNSLGAIVGRIDAKEYPSGKHVVTFNGSHLAPGMYLCRVKVGQETKTIHLVIVR